MSLSMPLLITAKVLALTMTAKPSRNIARTMQYTPHIDMFCTVDVEHHVWIALNWP